MQHFNSRNLTVNLVRAEFQFIIHEKKPDLAASDSTFAFKRLTKINKNKTVGGEQEFGERAFSHLTHIT